ncbi:DUF3810 domain-containing protein [Mucilaginibacter sp. UR6-11]|uniref:DUF3810 domain-containing protein n=1 Tax=Mucilaginibacter sp. UR6-11 TaxID=1435644 RepID=UPI001E3D4F78|nr:DUF3810 domain-containing protein [Mucilaginibacter sp. UR6-11]MCC8425623.1 DUF3810 domain-containing protein [Mucilaginibacter sp. UR6-11]
MLFKPNKIQKRLLAIAMLAVVLFLISVFEDHPAAVERYYSQGLYVFICRVLHPVFNLLPFSVGDVLYILVVAYLIYLLVKLIAFVLKKQFTKALSLVLGIVIGIQTGMTFFYLFWGLNYFRPSAGQRLNLRDTNYTTAHLQDVTCQIIDSANATRARITRDDTLQNNAAIYQTALKAVSKISADSVNFRACHPYIKSSLLTPLMNYLGTSGYYNPFTSEAQMNYQMPFFERPFVACHELSHQLGYGPEDEANFAGFLVGIGSADRLLRYSAYQEALDECMHALRRRDTMANNELKTHISTVVRNDFKAQRAYWLAYRGKIGIISSIFYDDYLKANNQPHGMDTYNQMVLLLMAWYPK